jgi:hypothetical protein
MSDEQTMRDVVRRLDAAADVLAETGLNVEASDLREITGRMMTDLPAIKPAMLAAARALDGLQSLRWEARG